MASPRILTARLVLTSSRTSYERGGVLVHSGQIAKVLDSPLAVERAVRETGAELTDLGDRVLTPGLVNAHAHLELSDTRGRLDGSGSFPDWIQSLLMLRAELGDARREQAFESGARELASSGCTLVADIDSCGLASAGCGSKALRVVAYREALDIGDVSRRRAVLATLAEDDSLEAVSPHAPYSVSPELAESLGGLTEKRNLQLGVHWSETMEENEWLEFGRGPFAELLGSGLDSPRRTGLELLRDSGLLHDRVALYHGNHPGPNEIDLVRDSGASLVHCPGTHAFFGREAFPLERWRHAGVNVALGTDSLASNESLDMLRELRLLRASFPSLQPDECFRMATENGARALGLADKAGSLRAGAWADFAVFETEERELSGVLDELTSGRANPCGTWIGGEPVSCEDQP